MHMDITLLSDCTGRVVRGVSMKVEHNVILDYNFLLTKNYNFL